MSATHDSPPTSHRAEAGDLSSFFPRMLTDSAWPVLPIVGVVAIVMGVLLLVWPGPSLLVVGILFGIYLLVSGFFQVMEAFAPHVPGTLRALSLISGALSILLGLICFRGAMESILLLAIWIGFGWLLRGTSMIALGAANRRGWLAFVGVLEVLGGIVLIVSPFRSIVVLTLVAGIWLIALGVGEVVQGIEWYLRRRRGRKHAAAT